MKKCIAILLALVMLAALAGCGQTEFASFRALEVIGEKQFCAICRGGDKLAPVIEAALATLAGNGTLPSITARWLGKDRSCLEGDSGALRALEATLEGYREGVKVLLDVLDAQQKYYNALNQAQSVRNNYMILHRKFLSVTGRIE